MCSILTTRYVDGLNRISRRSSHCCRVPDWDALKEEMRAEGHPATGTREELCEDPQFVKRVQRDAIDLTRELSDYERVKRVYLLPREFSIDKGEMTPTLKIKRGVIDEKFGEAIDEICGS